MMRTFDKQNRNSNKHFNIWNIKVISHSDEGNTRSWILPHHSGCRPDEAAELSGVDRDSGDKVSETWDLIGRSFSSSHETESIRCSWSITSHKPAIKWKVLLFILLISRSEDWVSTVSGKSQRDGGGWGVTCLCHCVIIHNLSTQEHRNLHKAALTCEISSQHLEHKGCTCSKSPQTTSR